MTSSARFRQKIRKRSYCFRRHSDANKMKRALGLSLVFVVAIATDHSTKHTKDYTYRLGDVVKAPYGGPFHLRDKVPLLFPQSIGAAYVTNTTSGIVKEACSGHPASLQKRKLCYDARVETLSKVSSTLCRPYYSKQNQTAIVVHLRLGDALCAETDYVSDSKGA